MQRVALLSPVLARDLLPAEQQVWPALCPAFSYRGGGPCFTPRDCSELAAERRWAATSAQRTLPTLARLQAEAALAGWQLTLARVAASLKLARPDEALGLLRELEHDSELALSLAAPRSIRTCQELTQSHWLWALAHVAIETEGSAAVLQQLWHVGLQEEIRRDARLGEQLWVNALQQARLDVLATLRGWNVRIGPETLRAVADDAARRASAYREERGPHGHGRPGNREAMRFLQAALPSLGLRSPCDEASFEAPRAVQAPPSPSRRARALWNAIAPRTCASLERPTRLTGVQTPPSSSPRG